MKHTSLILLLALAVACSTQKQPQPFSVIPMPNDVTLSEGSLNVAGALISYSEGWDARAVKAINAFKESLQTVTGKACDGKGGTMVSEGKQYQLLADTGYVQVSREEYEQVAPQSEGTFIEDIEGWDDFRKP